MRYRTNIDCLNDNELHDLREAVAGMYSLPATNPNSFAKLASFHGGPPTSYCRHGVPGFFTWHRAYVMAIEEALRSVRCDVTLPYWDWSSGPSTGVPEACRHATYVNRSGATVPNPLFSGPRPGGGQTARRGNIDTTSFDDLAVTAQAAMTSTTFESFQNAVSGVHGSVHGRTGGDMSAVPTASYDPIFYLHHANVDRLWAEWQSTHPGSLPAAEASFALEPFNRPFTTQWQQGSDVESTDALGYRYRRFCFFLPPIRLWELVMIDWPWVIRERMTSARLVLKTDRMPSKAVEIRAFLDQPNASERTAPTAKRGFAGSVGFLGHPVAHQAKVPAKECPVCAGLTLAGDHGDHAAHDHAAHNHAGHDHAGHDHATHGNGTGERFDVELNLTAAVRAADRDEDKLALKLVAVDVHGDHVDPEDVHINDIELVVE